MMLFGVRSVPPCPDCDGDQCTMNCGPIVKPEKPMTDKHGRAEEQLAENLKQQAQSWAMEARAHRATVHEAYQAVSGATGERGNWHGAKPIVEELDRLRSENEKLRNLLVRSKSRLTQCASLYWREGFNAVQEEALIVEIEAALSQSGEQDDG